MSERILITGAAGRVGTALRPLLARPGRILRLLDINPVKPGDDGGDGGNGDAVEIVTADFTDPQVIDAACEGVEAVVHLGGKPGEGSWGELAAVNVEGTRQVLEAVVRQGVPRVVLASSIHAAGFWARDDVGPDGYLPATAAPRPDTYYGASKAAMEALGSLYHSRFGIDVSCLRLGAYREEPLSVTDLVVWISHGDGARLVEACLAAPAPAAFRVVWGLSANTRSWFSSAEGAAIGYEPQDDAERFVAGIPGSRASTGPTRCCGWPEAASAPCRWVRLTRRRQVSDAPGRLFVGREADAAETVAAIAAAGGRAVQVIADVCDASAIAAAVEATVAAFGRLDVLVTSAGIQRYGTVADTEEKTWDEVFAVNVKGVFLAARAALPHLRRSGAGAIVVVSSVQAVATQANVAA